MAVQVRRSAALGLAQRCPPVRVSVQGPDPDASQVRAHCPWGRDDPPPAQLHRDIIPHPKTIASRTALTAGRLRCAQGQE